MRSVAATFGLLWGSVNLLASYLMVTSAFTAKTAMKEGILAQASLLVGGITIGIFAVALIMVCIRLPRARRT